MVLAGGCGGVNSNILEKGEFKLLCEWYGSPIKLELLYRGSEDGYKRENFWPKIEGYTNCFILARSTLDKRFGGFRGFAYSK
jgi:hypothetical protein